MAELTDVLGAIFRDVARSRVMSDLFSRDVSLEYAADEILSGFPVPRVEVRQATIDLRFAINRVEEEKLNEEQIISETVIEYATDLGRRVYSRTVLDSPRKQQILTVAEKKGLDVEGQLSAVASRVIEENRPAVARALADQPQALIGTLRAGLVRTLIEDPDIKRELTRDLKATDLRRVVGDAVTDWAAHLAAKVRDAMAAARRQALTVDVAVTKAELESLAETVVSHISAVVEIRNYEWTRIEEEEGIAVRRLRPE